jgi:hypothetical protein
MKCPYCGNPSLVSKESVELAKNNSPDAISALAVCYYIGENLDIKKLPVTEYTCFVDLNHVFFV